MVPKNIEIEHVIKAIDEIQRVGFPKNRVSRKYSLKYDDRHYPPKYLVCLANKYINGKMLEPFELGGVDVNLLAASSEVQVRQQIRFILERCDNRGYALGSGNSITDYVKVENYLAMLDEGIKFRKRA